MSRKKHNQHTVTEHSTEPSATLTVDELTAANVQNVIELEREVRQKRTFTDRIVDRVTEFCGSLAFVWIHLIWFGAWIAYDLINKHEVFDPYPYQLLTLIVSLEAILLSTFILISQNRDVLLAERRSQLGLQIELLSEQETTKILKLLDRIARKIGITDEDDPSIKVLEEATSPKRLVEQIDMELHKKP